MSVEQESPACGGGCSACELDCPSRQSPESFMQPPHPLSEVRRVIGVVSGKGGVGKSLVTSLLAVLMNRRGFAAGVLDADITGPSIPRIFGIREKAEATDIGILPGKSKTGVEVMSVNMLLPNETDPVVWRGPIISGMVTQFWNQVIWRDVDFLFVDMPPGTGDVPLTVFQSLPVDGIIIVATPQELVSMVVEKAVNMARTMEMPIVGLIENMASFVCPDCGAEHRIFGGHGGEAVAERLGIPLLGSVPMDAKLAAASDEGMIELFDGPWLDHAADVLEKDFGEARKQ